MLVPGGLSSLSTAAASNGPDGATELPSVLDNYQRTDSALLKRFASGSPTTISATLTLAWPDDYGYVEIAGSGEIVDIRDDFTWAGWRGVARFAAATTLSHSSNFALPGQAQIVTAAGDMAIFVRTLAGNYECVSYVPRATGALQYRNTTITSLSATATIAVPATGEYFEIGGSGEVIAIDSTNSWNSREVTFRFNAASTLSHSSNFALPGQGRIITAAGDEARFIRRASGTWECVHYERRSGGQWILLATGTASSSASLDFTDLTGYTAYVFVLDSILPATDAQALLMRADQNNGASFDAGTAYNYAGVVFVIGGTLTGYGATGADAIQLATDSDNGATGGLSGQVMWTGLGSAFKRAVGQVGGKNSAGTFGNWNTGGEYTTAGTVNAIQFLFASGNIASGSIKCYGIK